MIQMKMGSEGLGIQAGAQMKMGPVNINQYPAPPVFPEPSLKQEQDEEAKEKQEWGNISPIVVGKLQRSGFNSINDFSGKTREELLEIDGVGEKVADQILSFNK